jgi:hypothetical protein
VNVMDSDKNSLVKVEFSKMDVKAAFDKKDFDMKKNMTGAQLEIPVSGNVEEKELSVLYPTDGISGSELVDEQEVATKDGKRVVLTYDGEKSFTIIQEQTTSVPTMTVSTSLQGEVVDLGFTVGAMTDQSITWTHDGVDYMLASKSLTQDEMVTIARSVQGSMVK